MEKFRYLAKDNISKLPRSSGVYAIKRGRQFLYIGKAVNLLNRTRQHKNLLSLAEQIAYIETASEIDALLLEAELIKKHQPKYNVAWRDDKNYFYICITKEGFPRIFISHQIKNKSCSRSIGPFVEGKALKNVLKMLRKAFPYYEQKNHPQKLCAWCHLKMCPGPNPDKKEYRKNIKNLVEVLRGKRKSVLKNLGKEMKISAEMKNFEKAIKIRNQIEALKKVLAHGQKNDEFKKIEAYDVSNIQGKEATGSLVTFVNGKPDKNFYRRFKIKSVAKPNDVAMIKEIISRRLKHKEWPYPDTILIDGGKAQLNAAELIIKQFSNLAIRIMALAKENNELFIAGQKKPVLLENMPREISDVILRARDEAHRFARAYHHHLRKKDLLQ